MAERFDDLAPIASRPVLRATDRQTLAERLWEAYGAHLHDDGEDDAPMFAQANRVQIGDVTLHYCRYDAPVEITFSPMPGIRQFVGMSGRGQISIGSGKAAIGVDSATLIPAEAGFQASYGASYQQIVCQFDAGALRDRAEILFGRTPPSAAGWPTLQTRPGRASVRSREIAQALGRLLSHDWGAIDRPLVEMAEALSTAFLIENLHEFGALTTQPATLGGRLNASLLEDYIHANWDQPLTAQAIAAACGVSVRSVFAKFKQHRGMSPIAYLRDVRLDHARRMLLDDADDRSVIAVAMACGFASFGHFAQRYRDRFGELPSTTRARRSR